MRTDRGLVITQDDILNEITCFYECLYQYRAGVINVDIDNFLSADGVPKLSLEKQIQNDRPLELEEISAALKQMKNNTSPGLDGSTIEIF